MGLPAFLQAIEGGEAGSLTEGGGRALAPTLGDCGHPIVVGARSA